MNHKLSGLSSYLLLLLASAVPGVMLSSNAGVAATLNSSSYEDSLNHSSSVNFSANLNEKLNILVPAGESGNAIIAQFVRLGDPFVQYQRIAPPPPKSSNLQNVDEAAIAFNSRPSAMETFRSLNHNG
jgi:hypothetical protein